MEDLVIIEAKDYEQVIFENIEEFYPEGINLECLFSINELHKIDESDFVGIYRVGFKNSKDYFTCAAINMSKPNDDKKIKVVIDGKFYFFTFKFLNILF
jgi:hypothetical protein